MYLSHASQQGAIFHTVIEAPRLRGNHRLVTAPAATHGILGHWGGGRERQTDRQTEGIEWSHTRNRYFGPGTTLALSLTAH